MKKFLVIMLLCCCGLLSAQSYRVGDLYTAPDGSQGIVYYLCPDGSGGWVVALNDASPDCPWGGNVDVPGLPNQDPELFQFLLDDTAGYNNTRILRQYQGNSTTYAPGVVDFDNGWVLPSPAQLSMLYGQLPFIRDSILSAGGTLPTEDYYWCSAEQNASYAWAVYMSRGTLSIMWKLYSNPVRAVRCFVNSPYYLWSTGDTTVSISVKPNQTTNYAVTVTSADGRTASAETTVTVLRTDSVSVAEAVCDSLVWNGETYFHSGTYVQHLDNDVGCDSTVTLLLTVTRQPEITLAGIDTTCAGDSVTLSVSAANYLVLPIAVGDILCTDGSILNPGDFPTSGKVAMGVIFYVDNSGMHGWAVELQDSGPALWSTLMNPYYDVPTLDNYTTSRAAITDMDGYSNTTTLRAAGDANTYPIAYAVDFENGWYVPSAGQARILYANTNEVNASLQLANGTPIAWGWFWTSTEASSSSAWRIDDYGTIHWNAKGTAGSNGQKFRSIRNF